MRFLCDKCHAKYQIADEKAAGRTVRMKCRKCGHLIEVAASVTETSVSAGIMMADDLVVVGARDESAPAKSTTAGAGLSHGQPVAPAPRASAPRPHGQAAGAARMSPTHRESSTKAAAGSSNTGLAGAFSKAVQAPEEGGPSAVSTAAAVLSSSNTDEWYVGINGVPVGPVRLSELRRKAQQKLIDEESLVWREGFEEWVPLRTFPELVALLKEATATTRASLTPPPPVRSAGLGVARPASPAKTASSASPRARLGTGRTAAVEPSPEPPAAAPASSRGALAPSPASARSRSPAPGSTKAAGTPTPGAAERSPVHGQPPSPSALAVRPSAVVVPASRGNVVPIASRRGAEKATPEPQRPALEPATHPLDIVIDTKAIERPGAEVARPTQAPALGAAAARPASPPAAMASAYSAATAGRDLPPGGPASALALPSAAPSAPPASGPAGAADSLLAASPPVGAVVTDAGRSSTHPHTAEGKAERRRHRNVPIAAKLVPILIGVLGGMVLMLVIRPESQTSMPSTSAATPPHPPPNASQRRAEKPPEKSPESTEDTTTTIGPIELSAVAPSKTPGGGRGKGEPAAASPGANPGATPTSNNPLSSLNGLTAGPSVNGPNPSGAAGGTGGPLTEADISRVVQGRRAFVSRRCWEPALAAKPPSLPASAKVSVALSIAGDGRVADATATGGDGFPGLAGCVQGQVRTWTFPRNDGQSAIKIPFVFAGQ